MLKILCNYVGKEFNNLRSTKDVLLTLLTLIRQRTVALFCFLLVFFFCRFDSIQFQ